MTVSLSGLAARTAKRAGISPSARAPKRRGTSARILGFSPALRRKLDRAVNIIVAGGAVPSDSPDAHPLQKRASGDPLKAHLLITSCSTTGARHEEHRPPAIPAFHAYGVQ